MQNEELFLRPEEARTMADEVKSVYRARSLQSTEGQGFPSRLKARILVRPLRILRGGAVLLSILPLESVFPAWHADLIWQRDNVSYGTKISSLRGFLSFFFSFFPSLSSNSIRRLISRVLENFLLFFIPGVNPLLNIPIFLSTIKVSLCKYISIFQKNCNELFSKYRQRKIQTWKIICSVPMILYNFKKKKKKGKNSSHFLFLSFHEKGAAWKRSGRAKRWPKRCLRARGRKRNEERKDEACRTFRLAEERKAGGPLMARSRSMKKRDLPSHTRFNNTLPI